MKKPLEHKKTLKKQIKQDEKKQIITCEKCKTPYGRGNINCPNCGGGYKMKKQPKEEFKKGDYKHIPSASGYYKEEIETLKAEKALACNTLAEFKVENEELKKELDVSMSCKDHWAEIERLKEEKKVIEETAFLVGNQRNKALEEIERLKEKLETSEGCRKINLVRVEELNEELTKVQERADCLYESNRNAFKQLKADKAELVGVLEDGIQTSKSNRTWIISLYGDLNQEAPTMDVTKKWEKEANQALAKHKEK